jgi:hypothetical protein
MEIAEGTVGDVTILDILDLKGRLVAGDGDDSFEWPSTGSCSEGGRAPACSRSPGC